MIQWNGVSPRIHLERISPKVGRLTSLQPMAQILFPQTVELSNIQRAAHAHTNSTSTQHNESTNTHNQSTPHSCLVGASRLVQSTWRSLIMLTKAPWSTTKCHHYHNDETSSLRCTVLHRNGLTRRLFCSPRGLSAFVKHFGCTVNFIHKVRDTCATHSQLWGYIHRQTTQQVNTASLITWCSLLPYTDTAIKHPVPDQVKQSFVIFDIWVLWRSGQRQASKG